MRIFVRYETPVKRGLEHEETRREYNERFNQPSPWPDVPEEGQYLWDWYWDISRRMIRARDGSAEPILPSEFMAWKAATATIVHPHEYAILGDMDVAFRNEMNTELASRVEPEAPPPPVKRKGR